MVTKGHAPALRSTGLPVAGKTGTSSATMDTWFVGYTSRSMITTWIGDDRRERRGGMHETYVGIPSAVCSGLRSKIEVATNSLAFSLTSN